MKAVSLELSPLIVKKMSNKELGVVASIFGWPLIRALLAHKEIKNPPSFEVTNVDHNKKTVTLTRTK